MGGEGRVVKSGAVGSEVVLLCVVVREIAHFSG
jgi:hypothetical protein